MATADVKSDRRDCEMTEHNYNGTGKQYFATRSCA